VVWGKRTDGTTLTPFVDRASGGSLAEWVTTLDGVLKLDFDTAIPGHGPVLTKDNVRTFHRNLVTLRQRITDVVKSGAKQEEFGAKLKTDDLGCRRSSARSSRPTTWVGRFRPSACGSCGTSSAPVDKCWLRPYNLAVLIREAS